MKTPKFLIALTVLNLGLLVFLLSQARPGVSYGISNGSDTVLRGRALEIVDDRGRVRASIVVHPVNPANKKPDGKPYPETVMLRLIDPNGRPTVKLGASVEGAGMALMGDSDAAYIQLLVDSDSLVRLTNKQGREQVIKP